MSTEKTPPTHVDAPRSSDEQAAYEAGYVAGKSGNVMNYAGWHRYYYTCQDCHRDTSYETVHRCPVRNPDPYRSP